MKVFDLNGLEIMPGARVLVQRATRPEVLLLVESVSEILPGGLWNITGTCPTNNSRYAFNITALGIDYDEAVDMTVLSYVGDAIHQYAFIEETPEGKYKVRSEKNPKWNGGTYDTKAEAEKRLSQVEYWKHMKGSVDDTTSDLETKIPGTVEDAELIDEAVPEGEMFPELIGEPPIPPGMFPEGLPPNAGPRQKQLKEMYDAGVKLPPGLNMHTDRMVDMTYNTWKQEFGGQSGVDMENWWMQNYEDFAERGLSE